MTSNHFLRILQKISFTPVVIFLVIVSFDTNDSYGQDHATASEHAQIQEHSNLQTDYPEFPRSPGFTDYLDYAERYNPELKSSYEALKAAEEIVAPSGTLPDPQLNYIIDDMGSGVSTFQHKIELSQMFPWFGKRTLMREQAQINAEVARQAYVQISLKIRSDVILAYSEYYYLSKMISITEENMKLLSFLESVIRAKYTAGEENQAAIAKAQVELGMLEEQLQSLNDMTGTARAKLNAVLNLPSNYPLPVPDYLPDIHLSLPADSLTVMLSANNPVIEAMRMKSLIDRKDIELAHKQFYPDFMLGVGTERLMNKPMDGNRNSLMGMFSVTLPVWRSSYSHTIKAAQARAGSTEQELENELNNLESELKEVLYRYRDSERKISLYRDSLIPKTKELLTVSQRSYEAGRTDFLDIIDSQRTLIELELNYERALADRLQSISQAETLINEELIPDER